MYGAMSPPVLSIEGLRKQYGNFTALHDVSLEIPAGEIFALLGPNGAGKSTLIGAICGMVRKTAGKVRLFGIDIDEDPVTPRYRVGLVPQEINFDPFFNPVECLEIQQGYYGQKPDPERIREVLEAMQLTSKANVVTRALSGGMRRRLLIAKALVHRPQLVFLDEPTAGVDVELRRDLWSYIRRLRAEGTTVVLTTHYLEEAEELADRVGIIDGGRLLLLEEKAALLERLGKRQTAVHFTEPQQSLPEALGELGVVLSEDGNSALYTEQATSNHGSGRVLGALYSAGLPIRDVETQRPRLEEILIEVLRSGGAANAQKQDVQA